MISTAETLHVVKRTRGVVRTTRGGGVFRVRDKTHGAEDDVCGAKEVVLARVVSVPIVHEERQHRL